MSLSIALLCCKIVIQKLVAVVQVTLPALILKIFNDERIYLTIGPVPIVRLPIPIRGAGHCPAPYLVTDKIITNKFY